MKTLSCFGSYDADNSQCIRCNDTECETIFEAKMKCDDKLQEQHLESEGENGK